VWITRAPGMAPSEKTQTYERGTYYFFDVNSWRYPLHINTVPPVVHKAQDVMILIGENPFRGLLEGVGPENRDLFGP
jgi:hypothetical protein